METVFNALLYGFFQTVLTDLLLVCYTVTDFLLVGINELLVNSAVKGYLSFLQIFASFLFVIGIGFAVAEWAISVNEGSSATVMGTFKHIILGFVATLSFTTIPVILLKFTAECTELLIGGMTLDSLDDSLSRNIIDNFTAQGNLMWPVFIIVFIICIFRIFFANLKRGGILLIQLTACPFHIFSVPRGYVDSFFSWCKQVIALYLTTFTQNFLLALGVVILSSAKDITITNMALCVGVLLASTEAPRILQSFGLETSLKTNASQAVYGIGSAASTTINIASTFLK